MLFSGFPLVCHILAWYPRHSSPPLFHLPSFRWFDGPPAFSWKGDTVDLWSFLFSILHKDYTPKSVPSWVFGPAWDDWPLTRGRFRNKYNFSVELKEWCYVWGPPTFLPPPSLWSRNLFLPALLQPPSKLQEKKNLGRGMNISARWHSLKIE